MASTPAYRVPFRFRTRLAHVMAAFAILAGGLATVAAIGSGAADEPAPNLVITKSVDKTTAGPAETITYTIRFRCASLTTDCTGARIDDTLPTGSYLLYYTPAGGSVASAVKTGSTLTWGMVDPLPAGSSGTLQMKVRYDGPACLTTDQQIGPNTATFRATNAAVAQVDSTPTTTIAIPATAADCTPPSPPPVGNFSKQDRTVEAGSQSAVVMDLPGNGGAQYVVTDTFPTVDFYLNTLPWTDNYWEVSCNGGATWKGVPSGLLPGPAMTPSDTSPIDLTGTGCLQGALPDGSGRNGVYSNTATPMMVRFYVNGTAGAIGPNATARTGNNMNDYAIYFFASDAIDSGALTNCATATIGGGVTDCGLYTITGPKANLLTYKTLRGFPSQEFGGYSSAMTPIINGTTRTQAPDDLIWSITLNNFLDGGDIIDPVITDLLPVGLDYIPATAGNDWWFVDVPPSSPTDAPGAPANQPGCTNPTFTATPDWNGTGRTLLRWSFANCVLPGDQFQQPMLGYNSGLTVYVDTTLAPGIPAGTDISNVPNILHAGPNTSCQNSTAVDTNDLDGDGDTSEVVCVGSAVHYTVPDLATTESSKWVHGAADPAGYFSRYPNVGVADAAGTGTYEMYVENTGNIGIDSTHLLDTLPFVGDSMTIDPSTPRASAWSAELSGPVTIEYLPASATVPGGPRAQDWTSATTLTPGTDYEIWYDTTTNPCRLDAADQLKIATSGLTPAGCTAQPALGAGTAAGARSFGALLTHNLAGYDAAAGHGDMIRIVATVDAVGTLTAADTGKIAWNSFAYTPITTSTTDPDGAGPLQAGEMLSSEPIKVGLKVGPGISIGDYVWIDANHDGIQDSAENGVDGVTVTLWGPGPDATFGTADDVALDTYLTGDNPYVAGIQHGFYRFAGLQPSTQYQVRLSNPADFTSAGPLASYSLTLRDAGGSDAADSDAALPTSGAPIGAANLPTITLTSPAAPDAAAEPDDPTFDFGFWLSASLGDTVWRDDNPDGLADPTEPGVPGVTVNLYQPGPDGIAGTPDDVLIATQTTDSSGNYLFTDLAPGDYFVTFDPTTLPAGYQFTGRDTTGNDATDSDADQATGRTVITTLSAGEHDFTWDAGISLSPPNPASIGDYIWHDLNHDGIQDTGEPGLAGVTVNLLDVNGIVVSSTVTDTNGFYQFTGLTPGDYAIAVIPPAGYVITGQNQGSDDTLDSDIDPTPGPNQGTTAITTLVAGENDPSWDGGLFGPLSLGNLVWSDADNDGTVNGSEAGIADVTVRLYLDADADGTPDGAAVATTTTNSSGNYLFTGLAPGTYLVEVVTPAGFTSSTGGGSEPAPDADTDTDDDDDNGTTFGTTVLSAPVTLEATGSEPTGEPATPGLTDTAPDDRSNLTVDFGFVPSMSLGNLVWNDANNNGIIDGAEAGIDGVQVNLYADANADGTPDGAAVATTTTTPSGNYLFTGLAPGTYLVEVVTPAGFTSSTGGGSEPAPDADTDTDDGDDNGTTTGTAVLSAPITLTPGAEPTGEPATPGLVDPAVDANPNLTVDFGFFQTLSLGNLVWSDTDDDGIHDAGEPGIAGVTVKLYEADGVTEVPVGPDGVLGTADDGPGGVVTDPSGLYLFANLAPGGYVVGMTVPADHRSSTDAATTGTDNDTNDDDDGIGRGTGEVVSPVVTLAAGTESTGDGDTSAMSNLTVDFGVFNPNPAMTLQKLTNGCDAQTPSGATPPTGPCPADDGQNNPVVATGDAITWTYVVTNTGNVALTNLNVTDDKLGQGDIDCDPAAAGNGQPVATLAPGATLVCTATGVAVAGQYDNTGTLAADAEPDIAGTPPIGVSGPTPIPMTPVTDPSHYYASDTPAPALSVKKYTNTDATPARNPVDDADVPGGLDPAINHVVAVGDTLTWLYDVSNDGNVDLTDVTLVDDRLPAGAIDCNGATSGTGLPIPTLAAGSSVTCVASATVTAAMVGQYVNTATVSGTPPTGPAVGDSDPSAAFVSQPGIEVVKYTNTIDPVGDANAAPGVMVNAGSTVTWSYVVTNTGNTPLTSVTLTDDREGAITCPATSLDPGESMTCVHTGIAAVGGYTNLGTVTGVPSDTSGNPLPGNPSVSDDDPSNYTSVGLSLGDLVFNDLDDDGIADPGETGVGGVTVNLYAADGVTQVATTVTAPDGTWSFTDLAPGTYVVGVVIPPDSRSSTDPISGADPDDDVNGDDNAPGTGTGEVLSAPVTLTVGGEPVNDGDTSPDSNLSVDFGVFTPNPSMTLKKYTNGCDAQTASGATRPTGPCPEDDGQNNPVLAAGSAVTWTYVVTNTGNVALSDIVVSDSDPSVNVSCPTDTLAPGGVLTCTATGVAVSGQYSNTGTVTASGEVTPGGAPEPLPVDPAHSDVSHYYGGAAGLTLKKYTNTTSAPAFGGVDDADAPGGADPGANHVVAQGSQVWWLYVVTNTGNVALDSVTVTDDQGVSVTCPATTLAANDNAAGGPDEMTCVASGTATTPGQYTNLGSVTAVDNISDPTTPRELTAEDPSNLFVAVPGVDIVKYTNTIDAVGDADGPPGPRLAAGTPVTWQYVVTNTGNTTLVGIAVTDDVEGPIACPATQLAPNATMTCTHQGIVGAGDYANTGTVVGTPAGPDGTPIPGIDDVTDDNPSHYHGVTVSLGNTVWNDVDDDGQFDPAETGIGGVHVHLYGPDGVTEIPVGPDGQLGTADDAPGGVVTDPAGHYLFSGLNPGDYVVGVTLPTDTRSSTDPATGADPDDDVNSDDNGPGRATGEVRSAPVTLVADAEPVSDGDTDDNSNLTVDFGVFTPAPAVSVRKFTNGCDAQTASGQTGPTAGCPADDGSNNPVLAEGAPVTWTYVVHNDGNVPLTAVSVVDDQGVAVDCNAGANGTGQPFDLAVGAALTCTASGTAVAGQYSNVATVTASGETTPGGPDAPLVSDSDDSDPSHYFGAAPGLTVKKYTNLTATPAFSAVDDADVPAGLDPVGNHVVSMGTAVYWVYVVSNTGNVALSDVAVTDDRGVVVTCPATTLEADDGAPGGADEMTCVGSGTADTLGQYVNVGTATATDSVTDPANPTTLEASDPSAIYVAQPAVSITKYTQTQDAAGDADTGNGPEIGVTRPVTWFYVVTNTGDVPLTSVTVTDDVEGAVTCPLTALDPGETMTCEKTGTALATAGDYHNLATVEGVPSDQSGNPLPGFEPVSDDNPSAYHAVSASIGDLVWLDLDGDGIQDPGEPGIGGVTVNVLNSDGVVVGTAVTDDSGHWEVVDLPPGDYSVQFIPPAGYQVSPANQGADDGVDSDADATGHTSVTNLGAGEHDLSWDLGLYLPASIGDTVFADLNHDGIQDTGEPGVPGVTVILHDADGNPVGETVTDADGQYLFEDLAPGEYHLEFVVPDGWATSPADAGSDDGADSDANVTTGMTVVTTLSSGEQDLTWDAGIYQPVAIGDLVWADLNHDGIQDEGEPGIAGVTVHLYDTDGTLIGTDVTDADGLYLFDDSNTTALLPDTDYVIALDNPADYAAGGPLDGMILTIGDAGGDDAADSDGTQAGDFVTFPATTPAAGTSDLTFDTGFWSEQGDLYINKTAVTSPEEVRSTKEVVWELAVSNVGTDEVRGPITIFDPIQDNLTFVSAAGDGWVCDEELAVVRCVREAALAGGEDAPVVRLVTTVKDLKGPVSNSADVEATVEDIFLENNHSEAMLDISTTTIDRPDSPDTPVTKPDAMDRSVPDQLALTARSPLAKTGRAVLRLLVLALTLLAAGSVLLTGTRRARSTRGVGRR